MNVQTSLLIAFVLKMLNQWYQSSAELSVPGSIIVAEQWQ